MKSMHAQQVVPLQVDLLGPNPFKKIGEFENCFKLKFEPEVTVSISPAGYSQCVIKVLKSCASAQVPAGSCSLV